MVVPVHQRQAFFIILRISLFKVHRRSFHRVKKQWLLSRSRPVSAFGAVFFIPYTARTPLKNFSLCHETKGFVSKWTETRNRQDIPETGMSQARLSPYRLVASPARRTESQPRLSIQRE
jgi:hypothetical protein